MNLYRNWAISICFLFFYVCNSPSAFQPWWSYRFCTEMVEVDSGGHVDLLLSKLLQGWQVYLHAHTKCILESYFAKLNLMQETTCLSKQNIRYFCMDLTWPSFLLIQLHIAWYDAHFLSDPGIRSHRHVAFCILSWKMGETTSVHWQSTTMNSVSETVIDPMFRLGCVCMCVCAYVYVCVWC